MHIETFACEYANLKSTLLARLKSHVFHVTSDAGFAGISRSGFVGVAGEEIQSVTTTLAGSSFGQNHGYVCLIDLRMASDESIERTLQDFYYFLDPFTDSAENVFLVLKASAHSMLIPNDVGVNASGEAAIPELEVWYPGNLPLEEVLVAIRVPISRPDPWMVNLDHEAFMQLFPADFSAKPGA